MAHDRKHTTARTAIWFLLGTALITLSACNAGQRLSELGEAPSLSKVENPATQLPHIDFPQPEEEKVVHQPNSLWQSGARAFFKDQRASKVGDILTVIIQVSDKADLKNETTRARTTNEQDNITNLLGLESKLSKFLPDAVKPSSTANYGGTTQNDGKGEINRTDTISLRVAAVVTQVLPNGNLAISGTQEMTVNFELRRLSVVGVIRPEDISSANAINYDQIAEARIAYGGRGEVMDIQQARYGSQLFDILYPF